MKTISIHGKEYTPVNERVLEAHKNNDKLSIITECIMHAPKVVFKATVTTLKGTYIGHSAANPDKAIEKQSPYEVAETSAIGRAMGFAGYGIIDSIASADEMRKIGKGNGKSIMERDDEPFTSEVAKSQDNEQD